MSVDVSAAEAWLSGYAARWNGAPGPTNLSPSKHCWNCGLTLWGSRQQSWMEEDDAQCGQRSDRERLNTRQDRARLCDALTAGRGAVRFALAGRRVNAPAGRRRHAEVRRVVRRQSSFHAHHVATVKPQVVDDVVTILHHHPQTSIRTICTRRPSWQATCNGLPRWQFWQNRKKFHERYYYYITIIMQCLNTL